MRIAVAMALLATSVQAESNLTTARQIALNCTGRVCIGEAADFCMAKETGGYSTFGMVRCFQEERDVWQERLDYSYEAALETSELLDSPEREARSGYAVRVAWLKSSQEAWLEFNEANCGLSYARWGAGSMRLIAGAHCNLQMTAERVLELDRYLEGSLR